MTERRTNEYPGYIIDMAAMVCFGGAHPCTAVGGDGQTVYVLCDPEHVCDDLGCCTITAPAHEELGRLPVGIRRRINRCRYTVGAWRCSRAVPLGQTRCYQHQAVRDG